MYLKEPAGEGKFVITMLTDENIYSICPICGLEHQVDAMELVGDLDFSFTREVCCPYCTGKMRLDGLSAVMKEREENLSKTLQWVRKDD